MSLFGAGLFDDPFFQSANQMMRRHMQGMEAMMDPFMRLDSMLGDGVTARQQMVEDASFGRSTYRNSSAPRARSSDPFGPLMPFSGGLLCGDVFGGMNRMMQQMHQMAQRTSNDPNSHVFSHSTVMSYNNIGGRPEYYEATNSTRKAGDVKEVRKSVRDSREGLEKMEIGHHIGDRAHVIEKSRTNGGDIKQRQQFKNLSEDDARHFDNEWLSRTKQALGTGQLREGPSTSSGRHQPFAIEEKRRGGRNRPYKSSSAEKESRHKSNRNRGRDQRSEQNSEGPIIEEVE